MYKNLPKKKILGTLQNQILWFPKRHPKLEVIKKNGEITLLILKVC